MINLKRVTLKPRQYTYLGSTVLRGIQNNSTNTIDLLIRESIQNSLDAGLFEKDTFVDFSINEFSSNKILRLLEGINETKIKKIFPGDMQSQLVISDRNTTGLTGSLDINESSKSNIYKLIYSLGQPQEGEGAGGSWGYGKSIFYRVGIGLVMFYTRIKTNIGYEERLVFSLIENEKSKDKYAYYEAGYNSGISWWGDKEVENNETSSKPIEDSKTIHKILDIMNITPYFREETGTIISIPFIDENQLIDFGNYNGSKYKYFNLLDYIEMSIQRWYSPRINNDKYDLGKRNKLVASINGQVIKDEDLEKFFFLTREMYNLSKGNITKKDFKEMFPNIDPITTDINVRQNDIPGLVGNNIGHLSYASIHYNDLNMIAPKSINNPFNLINDRSVSELDENNNPIIMMTRQPGMIVKYDTLGRWANGIPKSPREEYTIGFFVLNSQADTYFKTIDKDITLEEYIRGSEKADHMDWADSHITTNDNKTFLPNIIHRITSNITRRIRENLFVNKEKGEQSSATNYLQNLLGETIMPPIGFGKKGSKQTNKPKRDTRNTVSRTKYITNTIMYDQVEFKGNTIQVPFKIQVISADFKGVKIRVLIKTEAGSLSETSYKKITTKSSPIKFTKIVFDNTDFNDSNFNFDAKNNELVIIKREEKNINIFEKVNEIKGFLILTIFDKNYTPDIRIEVIS